MSVWLAFALSSLVIVIAGIQLARYAVIIAEETRLGGMWVGSLLLAGATSLPEVATSMSAGFMNQPDIAVGNVFGSNMFNILMIALADVFDGPGSILRKVVPGHILSALLGILLSAIAALSILVRPGVGFLGVGLDSLAIALVYLFGVRIITRFNLRTPQDRGIIMLHEAGFPGGAGEEAGHEAGARSAGREQSSAQGRRQAGVPGGGRREEGGARQEHGGAKQEHGGARQEHGGARQRHGAGRAGAAAPGGLSRAYAGFTVAAVAVVVAGTILSRTGDILAETTGLGRTFVGSIFIAAATSLPEVVATTAAVLSGAYDIAVGNVLGSNIFNMVILLLADAAYRAGPILSAVSPAHAVVALFGLILSTIAVIGLFYRSRRSYAYLGPDSVFILLTYGLGTVLLYVLR